MRLVEVSALAAYLRREIDDDDPLANMAVDFASGVVSEYCDKTMDHQVQTFKMTVGGDSDALFLQEYPVHSVQMVTIDGPIVITAATSVSTAASFTTESTHGLEVGDVAYVTGVTPVEYNGNLTVTAETDTTFAATLAVAPAGSGTAFGTARLALETNDYELGDAGIVYYMPDYVRTTWPAGEVIIEATTGYGVDANEEDVPSTVSGVALQCAARIYDIGMVRNENVAGYSVNYVEGAAGLTSYEKDILAHHRVEV